MQILTVFKTQMPTYTDENSRLQLPNLVQVFGLSASKSQILFLFVLVNISVLAAI